MRIGHYAFDHTSPGGIASYVRRLTAAQEQRGDEIILLSRDEPAATEASVIEVVSTPTVLYDTAQALGLDVLHLHHPAGTVPTHRVPTVRTMHDNSGFCPSVSTFLARTEQPCDRAFTHAGCLWGHLVDHCGSRRPANLRNIFSLIREEQANMTKIPTMTVSEYMRDAIIRSGGVPDRLVAVRSPAPPTAHPVGPPPVDGPPRFLYASRLEPKKGLDWFLRALARCPTVEADVAGTGAPDYVDFMKRRAEMLGVADRVTFHGWLSEAELYALYRGARALVFPSLYHEPAGLVTLEAAALGRPVIASRVGGIPEYAHPSFSLLCEAGDVAVLATHITTLADDWDRAWAMGQAGVTVTRTKNGVGDFIAAVDRVYAMAMAQSAPAPSLRDAGASLPLGAAEC
jgi:glycosyltransferase involved in cell wall biosynthesis